MFSRQGFFLTPLEYSVHLPVMSICEWNIFTRNVENDPIWLHDLVFFTLKVKIDVIRVSWSNIWFWQGMSRSLTGSYFLLYLTTKHIRLPPDPIVTQDGTCCHGDLTPLAKYLPCLKIAELERACDSPRGVNISNGCLHLTREEVPSSCFLFFFLKSCPRSRCEIFLNKCFQSLLL